MPNYGGNPAPASGGTVTSVTAGSTKITIAGTAAAPTVDITDSAWVIIGSGGGAPAWQNAWAPFDAQGTGRTPQYRKVGGIVYLAGLLKNASGAGGLAAFTLPAGFRPLFERRFQNIQGPAGGFTSGTTGEVTVSAAGVVTPASNADFLFLDNISFPADQ
jgi:hypothetical protein